MSAIDELVKNNEAYATSFGDSLPLPPALQLAVLACMDARLHVAPTLMTTLDDKKALARTVLTFADSLR